MHILNPCYISFIKLCIRHPPASLQQFLALHLSQPLGQWRQSLEHQGSSWLPVWSGSQFHWLLLQMKFFVQLYLEKRILKNFEQLWYKMVRKKWLSELTNTLFSCPKIASKFGEGHMKLDRVLVYLQPPQLEPLGESPCAALSCGARTLRNHNIL